VQAGICLTSVSLYLETGCLPGLVFCLLLVPILRHAQGHALLSYSVHRDDWGETEVMMLTATLKVKPVINHIFPPHPVPPIILFLLRIKSINKMC
jgi:hypothetical protein